MFLVVSTWFENKTKKSLLSLLYLIIKGLFFKDLFIIVFTSGE